MLNSAAEPKLANILPELTSPKFDAIRDAVLPLLIYDAQIAAARPLLVSLGADSLIGEVRYLAEVNNFAATSFSMSLAERARQLGVVPQLREVLLDLPASPGRDQFLRATLTLLPLLLRSWRAPVSAMVAATFPSIYRELAKEADVPELLKFVPFFDWDRCKTARRELVDAFIASTVWKPGDLALTACRASDVGKILRRAAKTYGGEGYIERVSADLSRLPGPCREKANRVIETIRSVGPAKYDWRD
ncbi:MAG: hypothetical protein L0I29_00255 [Hyphomicrobiales bacterium]|nr:hypothetical protein [Hyphomicrobiales bacterium]